MRRALAILSFPYTLAGALVTVIDALPRIDASDEPAAPSQPPRPLRRVAPGSGGGVPSSCSA